MCVRRLLLTLAWLAPLDTLERESNLFVKVGLTSSQVRRGPVIIEHEAKLARMTRRTDSSWELVHANDVHAEAHRLVDLIDQSSSLRAADPSQLVEMQQHVIVRHQLCFPFYFFFTFDKSRN